MKNLLTLLLILFVIGILWMWSNFWEFSKETYVNPQLTEKASYTEENVDLEYLKKEFRPAYEF